MRTKRAMIVIILSILLLALAMAEFAVTSRLIHRNCLAFENLHNEMTVDEASQVLGRNLNNDLHMFSYFGMPIDDYEYKTEWWISPRYEFEVHFMGGHLSYKKSRRVPFSETWQELLYRGKQFVGR